ncbi:MAG: pyrimidine dimer DNA glycosylase/endonuclease V [Candidatus Omnitrophota bacterium]|jgi:hypothetical protein
MRLWSLHPKYLDRQGLVALWREALLAQAVLRGETRGYRRHPQLDRFRGHAVPLAAMTLYLKAVHAEARARGYAFDKGKITPARKRVVLSVTAGQIEYEWARLLEKLRARSPALYGKWSEIAAPDPHPLFRVRAGDVEPWERLRVGS